MIELLGALLLVNKASSPEPDCVSYVELTHSGAEAKTRLLATFNASGETGCFEPSWKQACVNLNPEPEKSLTELNSYRPIALLSFIGKLRKKTVSIQLGWLLMNKNAYPNQMSDLRKVNESAALRDAFHYNVDQTAESWVIFADSRAVLQSLKSTSTQDQLVKDMKRLCKKACDLHHRIVLQWIPTHCGMQATSGLRTLPKLDKTLLQKSSGCLFRSKTLQR
ncbi:hypothetical protein HPB51_011173 [Rhipicephalus microplus]|uniref:Tick transposon n=1 Tax=Rhipicephalus microplus TaxID=6941 RepID=A0A9J6F2C8_RHIMP|nr:hypothetical protein HPB51_011173 [Rhipicephalus microplus]